MHNAIVGIRTDHSGVGLGLAIVKSITQAHDGTLALTPRAAGGLCVAVQLPARHRALADDDQGNCRIAEYDIADVRPFFGKGSA